MPRSFFEIRTLTVFMVVCLVALTSACASTQGESDELGGETHYTLKRGEPTVHPKPLPVETPIIVKRFKSDGTSVASEGFRGWDFNDDGRFEMVDVLNADGSVQARLYDFDEDGLTDMMRQVGEK